MAIIFLFETDFEMGNTKYHVKVLRNSDDNENIKYECALNSNDEQIEIAKGYEGEWYDCNDGHITNLSEILGKLIDDRGLA